MVRIGANIVRNVTFIILQGSFVQPFFPLWHSDCPIQVTVKAFELLQANGFFSPTKIGVSSLLSAASGLVYAVADLGGAILGRSNALSGITNPKQPIQHKSFTKVKKLGFELAGQEVTVGYRALPTNSV